MLPSDVRAWISVFAAAAAAGGGQSLACGGRETFAQCGQRGDTLGRVIGQRRSTQKKPPLGRQDEIVLTQAIIRLGEEYGRYGYRRITAMLRASKMRAIDASSARCSGRRRSTCCPSSSRW